MLPSLKPGLWPVNSGGPGTWVTRTYSATRGGGAFLNGQRISVSKTEQLQRSLLVRPLASCPQALRAASLSVDLLDLLVQRCVLAARSSPSIVDQSGSAAKLVAPLAATNLSSGVPKR